MRSGTLNVPGIVGFGKAARSLRELEMAAESKRASSRCAIGSREALARARRGARQRRPEHRLPGNLNVSFAYVEGEAMMMGIKDVAVSSRLGVHVARASSPRTCCARWASATTSRTRRSASASAASHGGGGRLRGRPRDRQGQPKLRDMSPLYEMSRKASTSRRAVGGALSAPTGRCSNHGESSWRTATKSSSTTRTRATSAPSTRTTSVGTGLVGAPECGDVMRCRSRSRRRRHPGRQVQDLRLRLGDRVVVARHRVAEGQDDRRGDARSRTA
jgi:hypothetical protein